MKKILSISILILFLISSVLLFFDENFTNYFKKELRLINVIGWGYVLYLSFMRRRNKE
ncbi:hypothetical protein SAMN05192529_10677 [Arachidicoccus rhizosphaerae]|uniref:Uncharacterized protein n=1 Tax=Arachidicoccus rhizosphaerae TaxID=551991 RepID=A0A1H3XT43_9BACT|nr:hypothetical protein SAMN05192529_10677 [Arachidicoccus rhizosphaerae]